MLERKSQSLGHISDDCHLLIIGSPGSGKTMLAKRLSTSSNLIELYFLYEFARLESVAHL
jgi:predicted ATPase with chaperone activity